ncbi:MAG: hypothetical protein CME62_15160 [Halobacteriovoraceae bacterium]|nr:hypothetical protein [Halobacteriovoraceae bacterium]|tara:strand:- start:6597 stop:7955 length:1359 start_codon:yes stop_codon:yes gene_type:complete
MSQAILISNNEVVNSLYEVNLRAYVATNVTIKNTMGEALKLLEHAPNIDAIISFIDGRNTEKSLEKLFTYLNENNLKTPVIVLGVRKRDEGRTIYIENRYEIKALLKSMAKILGITAKDMAQRAVPEYFPVPINLLAQVDKTFCDVYFRNQKADFEYEYFKILEEGSDVTETIQKYTEQDVNELYIDSKHRLHFINQASASVVSELSRDDISTEERVELTKQGMNVVAEEVFASEEISEKMAEVSKACVMSIRETVKDVPKLKNLLKMLLEDKGDICYKHSIISTYIATQIIKNISWGSEEQANKVAFSFFFHDIYLVPVFKKYPDAVGEEDLLFRDDVDEKDKQIVLEHAKKAGQLIKTFPKCPMGADMIITQHHGMTSGEGFATTFKDDISPLSKIMIIAEEVAMVVLELTKDSLQKFELDKEKMQAHLQQKFKNHTYKKIVEAFGQIEV